MNRNFHRINLFEQFDQFLNPNPVSIAVKVLTANLESVHAH